MKKKLSMIMLLIALSLNQIMLAQSKTDMLKAKQKAASELQAVLSKMPVGDEQSYGFKSREEFTNAKIEDLTINESIGHDEQITFNRYRFIISVNNEPRAIVSYKKEENSWVMSGFGATNLAKEINGISKKRASQKAVVAYLVRINDKNFKGDFIKYESTFKEEIPMDSLIPLVSAKESLSKSNRSTKTSYMLDEIMQLGLEKSKTNF
jgi:hypothetical protein